MNNKNNETEEIFKESGAILTGHIVLNTGEHSDTYLIKEKIYYFYQD